MFILNRKTSHHSTNKESHNLNLQRQSKRSNTDVDFKAAIIKMFSRAKNMLGTNKKLGSLSKEIEDKRRPKWKAQN